MTRSLTAVSANWLSTFRAIPAMACSLPSVTFAMALSMPRVTLSSYHARDCQPAPTKASAETAIMASLILRVITLNPPLNQPSHCRRQSHKCEVGRRGPGCYGAYVAKHLHCPVPYQHHVIDANHAG